VSTRNFVYESLIIRARESPGGSRVLTLMTAESGLVDVFVFGGPKSRLRSIASPYVSGRAFVYLDPVKDYRKLTDFELKDSFPALREELGRLWGAGLVAELLLKTSGGGGDYRQVFELALSCLASLDSADTDAYDQPVLLFCWRLIGLLGLGPDPSSCVLCGRYLRVDSGAAFSFERDGFFCPACAGRVQQPLEAAEMMKSEFPALGSYGTGEQSRPCIGAPSARVLRLGPAALRWLSETAYASSLDTGSELELETAALESLKSLVYGLIKRAVDAPLHYLSRRAALV